MQTPVFLPKGGTPRAFAGVGQRQALAWRRRGPGWAEGSRLPSGSVARDANSPPVLQTSLLAQKQVPVPFLFLCGDAMSVRWFVGIAPGSGSPATPCAGARALGGGWWWSCKPGRGALLSAPPGSSLVAGIVPFPPKDFMNRCAQLFLNVNLCTDVQIQCSCYRMNKVLF